MKDGAELRIKTKTTGSVIVAAIAIQFFVGVPTSVAHTVSVWAHVEDGVICAECYFPDGRRVIGGTIRVYDDQNRLSMTGTTDPEGRYCFEAPKATGVRIVLNAGEEHEADWRLSAKEIEAAGDDPSTQLDPITVSARRIEERLSGELSEYGHPVQIIPGEAIEKAGYTDLNQALQALVPGLSVSVKGGRGDYAITRLRGGSQVLWLLDGVRLNNRLYGSGYMDTISVRMIDRIEILKGGQGLFYGTDAAFGVINVITKSVSEDLIGGFGLSFGSYDHQEIFGDVSDSFKGHGVLLFGNYETWDGYRLFSDEAHDLVDNHMTEEHGFERTNMGAKYRKHFDLLGIATLKLHLQRNEGEFDFSELAATSAVNERIEDIGFLKWDHDIGDRFSYYIKTYMHRWWTDHTRWKPDGALVNDKSEWGYEDWGVNLMGSWRFGQGHEILLGGDYQNYWAEDEVWHIQDKTEEVRAVFAEYRPHLFFSPRTRLAVGGRYNWTGEYDKSIWYASFKTPLYRSLYLRGMAGTSFRLPTAEHLYLEEENAYGNRDLEPEEGLNADIGFGGDWSIFTWDIGYFYQKITDPITLLTYGSSTRTWTTFENTDGKTEIDGIEIQLTATPIAEVTVSCSAAWVNIDEQKTADEVRQAPDISAGPSARHHQTTHDDANPDAGVAADAGAPNIETGDTPELTAKAVVSYRHASGRFGTDLAVRYIGNTYSRYDDRINYGDYTVADLSGFVTFGRENRHTVTLRLENLFDEDYTADVGRAQSATSGEPFYYLYRGMPFSLILGYSYAF